MLVFIMPPSLTELRRRLEGRATETPERVEKRLRRAREEIQEAHAFRYVIVNDDLDRAVGELLAVQRAERAAQMPASEWTEQDRAAVTAAQAVRSDSLSARRICSASWIRRGHRLPLELIQGDIAAQNCAAVVTAANKELAGGGGRGRRDSPRRRARTAARHSPHWRHAHRDGRDHPGLRAGAPGRSVRDSRRGAGLARWQPRRARIAGRGVPPQPGPGRAARLPQRCLSLAQHGRLRVSRREGRAGGPRRPFWKFWSVIPRWRCASCCMTWAASMSFSGRGRSSPPRIRMHRLTGPAYRAIFFSTPSERAAFFCCSHLGSPLWLDALNER